MEKVLSAMPNMNEQIKAKKVLEINGEHAIYSKIKKLFEEDKQSLNDLIEVIYSLALIIEGMEIENPTKLADKVCALLS